MVELSPEVSILAQEKFILASLLLFHALWLSWVNVRDNGRLSDLSATILVPKLTRTDTRRSIRPFPVWFPGPSILTLLSYTSN